MKNGERVDPRILTGPQSSDSNAMRFRLGGEVVESLGAKVEDREARGSQCETQRLMPGKDRSLKAEINPEIRFVYFVFFAVWNPCSSVQWTRSRPLTQPHGLWFDQMELPLLQSVAPTGLIVPLATSKPLTASQAVQVVSTAPGGLFLRKICQFARCPRSGVSAKFPLNASWTVKES